MENDIFVLDLSKNDFTMDGGIKRFINENYDILKEYNFDNNTKMFVTNRCIDNGDFFLYFDIKKPKNQKISLKLNSISNVYSYEDYYEKPHYDNRYGENKVKGPYAYLDFVKGSAIISKLYYYRELRCEYPDGQYSYLLELSEENKNIEIKNNMININIAKISNNCSFFVLLSNEKLFNNKENSDEFFKNYYEGIRNSDVKNSYFVRYNGTYTKLPYSIEPFTRDGYGFSLHHSSKKELITYLRDKKDRYYYDLIVNSIMQTFLYQKNDNGVFYTPYTSTWLKKDTGITAPYIDTRLNETFNLMLHDFKEIYPEFKIKDNTQNYCDYLIKQVELGKTYELNDGLFFPDYFKDGMTNKTHSSLNHQLGIFNMMFNAYKQTQEEKYLNIAKKILIFLKNTYNRWINPSNQDLFYSMKIHENGIEMEGTDYVYVTLIDLLLIQKTLGENNLNKSPEIDKLIASKMEYLNNSGYSIFDFDAKLAPGEPIESREKALELYTNEYLI